MVVAGLLALAQFFWPEMPFGARLLFAAVVFYLVGREIRSIYRERAEQKTQFNYLISHVTQSVDTAAAAIISELKELKAAILPKVASQRSQTGVAKIENPGTEAIELYNEIHQFLLHRQMDEPPMPKSETWDYDVRRMEKHIQETIELYSAKYQNEITKVRDKLATAGIVNDDLDSNLAKHIVTTHQISSIARMLGSMGATFLATPPSAP